MTESDAEATGALTQFDHDAWRTLASAGVGYGIVLLAMFVALFVVPFVVFLAF